MKKSIICYYHCCFASFFSVTVVFAGGHGHGRKNFVSKNYTNAYCQAADEEETDLWGRHNSSCFFVDEDGDGVCDRHGSSCSFLDEGTETVSAIDAALPALSWTKTETVSATGTALFLLLPG